MGPLISMKFCRSSLGRIGFQGLGPQERQASAREVFSLVNTQIGKYLLVRWRKLHEGPLPDLK